MEIYKYAGRRIVHGLFVLLAIVTILFLIRVVYPGNPAYLIASPDASQAVREAVARDLGLDKPIYVQYFDYLENLLRGDLGYSYRSRISVTERIADRLPATIELAVAATLISIILAIPFGVISATNRNTPMDTTVTLASLVGVSTPNFWFGILLLLLFPVILGIGPTGGRGVSFVTALVMTGTEGTIRGLVEWFSYIVLPAVTLGTYYTALLTRLTRGGMLEELGQLYIRAGRAKGLWETLLTYKHALRNTLAPLITILGLQIGRLIGGSIVVESVFNYPGVGTLFIRAVTSLDWPMISGVLLLTGAAIVTMNIIVDISYTYLDPEVGFE